MNWLSPLIVSLALPVTSNLRTVELPEPFGRVVCHRQMFKPLTKALQCVMLKGVWSEIRSYDGCYNNRTRRTNNRLSEHAYGTAIDINASSNRMGDPPTIHPLIVQCFREAGFTWGGEWHTPDGMHFELERR